jgi:hypothetical protein
MSFQTGLGLAENASVGRSSLAALLRPCSCSDVWRTRPPAERPFSQASAESDLFRAQVESSPQATPYHRKSVNAVHQSLVPSHVIHPLLYSFLNHSNTPSISPGNRPTRRCSQFCRSFACNLCTTISLPFPPVGQVQSHIILILHIHLPSLSPQPHSILLRYLLVLSIVPLVSQCRCGR